MTSPRLAPRAAGAVPPLVALLGRAADPRTLALAAGALANLAFLDAARPIIVEAGAIAPLVALANVAGGAEVLGNVSAALRPPDSCCQTPITR